MPDFHQPILLPTLHHLADARLEEREDLLKELTVRKPVALVIPALYAELGRKALPRMLEHLSCVRYVSRVIVSMNGMTKAQHIKAVSFFAKRLPVTNHTVLWNDGPALEGIHREVAAHSDHRHAHGKGSNVWMGIVHLLANGHRGVIACHDSDILSYDRNMLWRLCLPVAHPDMGYVFAKSYYGRVRERMYGRVTRLLVFPLLQALREVFGSTPLLRFLAMCRYPLSGEFAADTEFISRLGMTADWGLEIGMLCDVFRLSPAQRFCQVDLGGNFEHKHQHLDYDAATGLPDASSGLAKMAREVTGSLMTHLWNDLGFSAEPRKLERLADAYVATAQVLLTRYKHEALFNGLEAAEEEEFQSVKAFGKIVRQVAGDSLRKRPSPTALPSWEYLKANLPDIRASLSALP